MSLVTLATSPRGAALPVRLLEADQGGGTSGSDTQEGLEGAGSTPAATAGATSAQDAARINALMGKWQSSDAEVTRLQGLLATAVAHESELQAQITELQTGQNGQLSEAQTGLTAAQARVAELEADNAKLTAETARLGFLVAHQDMIPFAALLPSVADTNALEAAATTIRTATAARQTAMREHLTTPPAGSSTPRKPAGSMTPQEIDAYLRSSPRGEFEQRLKEVTGRA